MICKQDIQDNVFRHIAQQMKCSIDDLHSGKTIYCIDEAVSERYVKILSAGDTDVVTVSADVYQDVVKNLHGKTEMNCMRVSLYLDRRCTTFQI